MTDTQPFMDEARRTAEAVVSRYAGQAEPIDKLVDRVAAALSSAYQRGREDAALVAENCVPHGIHPDDLYRWRKTADALATAIRTQRDKG